MAVAFSQCFRDKVSPSGKLTWLAMENGPFEDVSPMEKMVVFHCKMLVYQNVRGIFEGFAATHRGIPCRNTSMPNDDFDAETLQKLCWQLGFLS